MHREFGTDHLKALSQKKKKETHITIYGSYKPKEKERLKDLRDYLKSDGFLNTSIVEDYPDNDTFTHEPIPEDNDKKNYLRSVYAIDNSDINVFVYTYRMGGGGFVRELSMCLDENKISNILIFTEKREREREAMSSIIRGELKKLGEYYCRTTQFENDDELKERCLGKVIDLVFTES